jgi:hypothetical protein
MAHIRFTKNINLKVTYEGEGEMVPFGAGEIFQVERIEVDAEGYNNIYMPDGSVLPGVASEIFEKMGKVPTTQIEEVAPEESQEFEVEEPEDEMPAVLDGTMLSNEETDDEPDPSTAF